MRFAILAALEGEERRRVLGETTRRRFDRREILFHEDDPGDTVHLIERGRVAVRITTEAGEPAMVDALGAGDMVGLMSVLGEGARRAATVVALERTDTLSISRARFDALRRSSPTVDQVVIDALAAGMRRLNALLLDALYAPVEVRVLRRLADLTDLYGRGSDPAAAVEICVTQHDLATMAGTSRATANRVLRDLENAGLVSLTRNRIEVVDRPALARRAT